MRKLPLLALLLIWQNVFAQNQNSTISISGQVQKRIDLYTKTYKIRKKYSVEPLEKVSLKVVDSNKKTILQTTTDAEGKYNISFELQSNMEYTLSYSKDGYFSKSVVFNTENLPLNKHIPFHDWTFSLYKRVIGMNEVPFNKPLLFYYDNYKGIMSYNYQINEAIENNQENEYFNYLSKLNETEINQTEMEDFLTEETENTKKTNVKDTSSTQISNPKIQIIDMDSLLSKLKKSGANKESVIEDEQKKMTKQWQQLEIAKMTATSKEDSANIVSAELMLLEKERQIKVARDEIELAKKQIQIQKAENRSQKLMLLFTSSIIIFVSILLFVLFRNNKERKKINKLLEVKNKEVLDSIKYAQRLQNAILPPDNILKKNLKNSFVFYIPKDIVSGDFYYVENLGDKTIFGVVDCTGHGVPGAFMSIVAYNALNQAINQNKLEKPSEILNNINANISKTLHKAEYIDVEDGMDMSLCYLNYENDSIHLEYAGAQHSLCLVRNGELKSFKGDKYAIGSLKSQNKSFKNINLELIKGDVIYLFSDGYADQFGGPKQRKFMYKIFKNLLVKISSEKPEKQLEILKEEFYKWKGKNEQVDDICVMGVIL